MEVYIVGRVDIFDLVVHDPSDNGATGVHNLHIDRAKHLDQAMIVFRSLYKILAVQNQRHVPVIQMRAKFTPAQIRITSGELVISNSERLRIRRIIEVLSTNMCKIIRRNLWNQILRVDDIIYATRPLISLYIETLSIVGRGKIVGKHSSPWHIIGQLFGDTPRHCRA